MAIVDLELPAIPERGLIIGMARLARALFEKKDLKPIWNLLHERIADDPTDVDAIFDASLILRLIGQFEAADNYLRRALEQRAYYTVRHGRGDRLSLLVFLSGADVMANAPIDFLLEDSQITVHYIHLDSAGITDLPHHDVAFMAIGEAAKHQQVLAQVASIISQWPAPVMNADTHRIAAMTRDQVAASLAGVPQILCPENQSWSRFSLTEACVSGCGQALPSAFPLTIRPVGTDCGKGLERMNGLEAIGEYISRYADDYFFVSPFIDYSAPDGEFRKYRIAFIDGQFYPVHLAISPDWIVHYLSAGMSESFAKRTEEAQWMDNFETNFAVRHRIALETIQARIGTDYFAIDCGEAPDGRLLFFEADVASIIHALDPIDQFAYKRPHMARLFEAFIAALERRIVHAADRPAAA